MTVVQTGTEKPRFWRPGARAEAILACALALSLAWVALPFGSNVPAAWGINAILFGAIAITLEVMLLAAGKSHPVSLAHLAIPAALFASVLVWILLQEATWTPASWHHPIWDLTARTLERPVEGSISVNRDLTAVAFVRLLTAAGVFWASIQLCRDEGRARFLIWALGVIISAYAAFGIFAAVTAPGKVLWLDVPVERGFVTSTFMNRNTFATYAGLGFLVNCGLFLNHYRHVAASARAPLRYRVERVIAATRFSALLVLVLILIDFAALALTGSRGALVASALGLVVLNALWFGRTGLRAAATGFVLALGAIAALFAGFGDAFVHSIAQRGFYDANRMSVFAIVARSIADRPVLGHGYGTFSDLFPMLRDTSVGGFDRWEMAHDIYLELLQGLGVVFGAALIGCVLLLVLRCFRGAVTRRRSVMFPCVAASASVLVGLHALVDYSLQVQAIALTFFAILGAGSAQSVSSRKAIGD